MKHIPVLKQMKEYCAISRKMSIMPGSIWTNTKRLRNAFIPTRGKYSTESQGREKIRLQLGSGTVWVPQPVSSPICPEFVINPVSLVLGVLFQKHPAFWPFLYADVQQWSKHSMPPFGVCGGYAINIRMSSNTDFLDFPERTYLDRPDVNSSLGPEVHCRLWSSGVGAPWLPLGCNVTMSLPFHFPLLKSENGAGFLIVFPELNKWIYIEYFIRQLKK